VRGLAEVRAAAAAHLSPAGQVQVATALEMMTVLEGQLHELRHQLLDAAGHMAGAKVLAERIGQSGGRMTPAWHVTRRRCRNCERGRRC